MYYEKTNEIELDRRNDAEDEYYLLHSNVWWYVSWIIH